MKQNSDKELRELAERLGDWIQSDVLIHVPEVATVEREACGAWVECRLLVPWNKNELPWNTGKS